MTVYKITTLARPPRGNFPNYADLACHEKDTKAAIGDTFFLGKPYPRRWNPVELYVRTPSRPRPHFYRFTGKVFVCSAQTRDLIGEALVDAGEFLPVTIENDPGQYFIYNITNCMNVVDPAQSIWHAFGPANEYRTLVQPAFRSERFEEESVFKIPEDAGGGMYCLERTGDPADGEFKALVQKHKLTGLEFTEIWNDRH